MSSFNKSVLMGNMTRDPQLKHLPSNIVIAEFGLACNRKFKTAAGEEREEVLFIDCAAFGRTGEVIGQHFVKGKPILVEGRLKLDTWEDKNGGGKRSKISLVVETFAFVGGKADGDGNGGGGTQPRQQQQRTASNQQDDGPPGEFSEADIPF